MPSPAFRIVSPLRQTADSGPLPGRVFAAAAWSYVNLLEARLPMNILFVVFMSVIPDLAPTIAERDDINGVITMRDAPGAIAVVISVGRDDGVKVGDEFVVRRNKREIGKLVVVKTERDLSLANIIAVNDKLERGYSVVHE